MIHHATMFLETGQHIDVRFRTVGEPGFPRVDFTKAITDTGGGTYPLFAREVSYRFGSAYVGGYLQVTDPTSTLNGCWAASVVFKDSGGTVTDVTEWWGQGGSDRSGWFFNHTGATRRALQLMLPRALDAGGSAEVYFAVVDPVGTTVVPEVANAFRVAATYVATPTHPNYPGYLEIKDATPIAGTLPDWWSLLLTLERAERLGYGESVTLTIPAGTVYTTRFTNASPTETTEDTSPAVTSTLRLPTHAELGTIQTYTYPVASTTTLTSRPVNQSAKVLIYQSDTPGTRARITFTGMSEIGNQISEVGYERVLFKDLDIDSDQPSAYILPGTPKRTLWDNCRIRGIQLTLRGWVGFSYRTPQICLRRCAIHDQRRWSGHVAGVYSEHVQRLVTHECVFLRCGFKADPIPAPAYDTIFNHAVYAQTNVAFVLVGRCWFLKGSGADCQFRAGGHAYGTFTHAHNFGGPIAGAHRGRIAYGMRHVRNSDGTYGGQAVGWPMQVSAHPQSCYADRLWVVNVDNTGLPADNGRGLAGAIVGGTNANGKRIEVFERCRTAAVGTGMESRWNAQTAKFVDCTFHAISTPLANFDNTPDPAEVNVTKLVTSTPIVGTPDLWAQSRGFADADALYESLLGGTWIDPVDAIDWFFTQNGEESLSGGTPPPPPPPPPDPEPEPSPQRRGPKRFRVRVRQA